MRQTHHHHRSKTLINCINQITKTHYLHENLQKIYSRRCKCQTEYYQQRQKSYQRNINQEQMLGLDDQDRKLKNVQNWIKRDAKCMKCNARFVKHQKLSQLHRKNYYSEINRKNQQLYNKNKKIVHRLINTKSVIGSHTKNSSPSHHKNTVSELQIVGDNNSLMKKPVNSKGLESSSSVNRRRQSKRIQTQNRSLQKRLISAMKKSKYSQKIKEQHSTRSQTQFARRTTFNTQNQRNYSALNNYMNLTSKSKSKLQDKNYYSENNVQLYSIVDSARKRQRIQNIKGRTYTQGDLTFKSNDNIRKKQKVYGSQIMRVLQQSLEQMSGQKKVQSREDLRLQRSQSIEKMRKAAMIHYRKLQKMKQTQSKFRKYPLKLTFEKNDRIKNLTMTEYMPIQDRLTKDNQTSLLLTEIV